MHDLGEDNVLTRGKEKAVGMTRKFRGVESFSKTTQTNLASFMGQVEPVKAPELDSRVKRHLAEGWVAPRPEGHAVGLG